VSVWDLATMKRLAQWVVGDAAVTDMAFAPDSRTLAVGDAKGLVQVWDLPSVLAELGRLGLKPTE
jgi:WD40 repeat protein